MIRTQIYIPETTHAILLRIAREQGTTLSKLIRQGANQVINKHASKNDRQQAAVKFFANPPKKYQVKLAKPAHVLVRAERD